MKKILLVVSLLCVLIPIAEFSQASEKQRYYYAYDEKVFLDEVENKLVICFQPHNVANLQVKALINTKKIESQNDSVCVVNIENGKKETLRSDLLQIDGIKSVQPMYAVDGLEMGVTDEIVMKFKEDISQQQIDELHKKYGVSIKKITDLFQLLSVPNNIDALEIANQYQLSGLVKYSHPNFISKVEKYQAVINDPYFVHQFYLHNTGQTVNGRTTTAGADIRARQAWNITKGSGDVIVAVLDDGVTSDHPDLPNSRQVRLNGSNFATGYPNDPSPVGDDTHGNGCAGIIAASHNNEGIAGIAPNCKIMPVRMPFDLNTSETLYAKAIIFATDNGAHILSNSWGYENPNPNLHPVIRDAIIDAASNGRGGKGCIVVFAAGNSADHISDDDGLVEFPANVNITGTLRVGASDRNDRQANYSPTSQSISIHYPPYFHYGQIIDVVAPSHHAYSWQIPTETWDVWSMDTPGYNGDNPIKTTDGGTLPQVGSYLPTSGTNYLAYTGHFGGTSAACPQVAGVAALILSVNPDLTQSEVTTIIKSTARKAGDYDYESDPNRPGWNRQMGHGVVNAHAAVLAALESCAVNLTDETINDTQTIEACAVNVDNVTLGSSADVTISGRHRVEITSLQMEDGSSLVVNNGVAATQSSASPLMASRAVTENTLVEAAENVEESTINTTPGNGRACLYQNRPNPFTGKTIIGYYLPEDSGPARLRIIDMNGITVKTVDIIASGEGTVVLDADALPKGIYLYSLIINGRVAETRRMVLE